MQVDKNLTAYQREMLKSWEEMPPFFVTSATSETGRDEVLNFIQQLNDGSYE
jgi:GTP-binding protein